MFQHADAAGFPRGQFFLPDIPEVIVSSELRPSRDIYSSLEMCAFCWKAKKSYRNAKQRQKGLSPRRLWFARDLADCGSYGLLCTGSLTFSVGKLPFSSWHPPCPPCSWGLNWAASARGIQSVRGDEIQNAVGRVQVVGYHLVATDESVWREEQVWFTSATASQLRLWSCWNPTDVRIGPWRNVAYCREQHRLAVPVRV